MTRCAASIAMSVRMVSAPATSGQWGMAEAVAAFRNAVGMVVVVGLVHHAMVPITHECRVLILDWPHQVKRLGNARMAAGGSYGLVEDRGGPSSCTEV